MLKFALYVSNHGFGHASRVSALAEQLISYGVYCHIISEKPQFLFSNLDSRYFTQHFRSVDSGVKHGKNLVVDLDATKAGIIDILGNRNRIVSEEIEFIRKEAIDLIIADIPYIVTQIAQYANIPVFALSNFEWHYIYSNLFTHDTMLKPVLNTIWSMYQNMDRSFMLPFSNDASVAAMPKVEKCGLLARRKKSYSNFRKEHGWDDDTKLLLVMFGGEGSLELDYEVLCEAFNGMVISNCEGVRAKNHCKVSFDDDYIDLMYNTNIILCKPGYSTLAEAVQFGKFIIYFPRGVYPEEIALLDGLKSYPNKIELNNLNNDVKQWKQVFKGIEPRKVSASRFRNRNSDIAGLILKRYIELAHPEAKLLSVFDMGSNSLNYALYDMMSGKTLHKAHTTTQLGRNFRNSMISQPRIAYAKKAMTPLLVLDKCMVSEKVLIATGVSRTATNASTMLSWVKKKYNISARVISERDEAHYVYHAVKDLAGGEEAILAVDVGGASTEFVFYGEGGLNESISIPFGLLTCLNDLYTKSLWVSVKDKLPTFNPTKIVGVGLTYAYLAAVVFKGGISSSDNYNGRTITKSAMIKLISEIKSNHQIQYMPYLQHESYLPILTSSLDFTISVLDKYSASEILVCTDGISIGYAKWRYSKSSRKLM